MSFTTIALAVLAVAQSASGVKWVPLTPSKPAAKPVPPKASPSPPVQPTPAVEPALPTPQPRPTASATTQAELVDAVPATSAPPPTRGRLDLTCLGAGTANKLSVATVNSNSYVSGMAGSTIFSGSGTGSATVFGSRQQGFNDQVDIRLFGGDDRIRMPRTMLPLFRGGKAGWFKLKNVVADTRSIRASAAVNVMNNPKVHIDRVTGTISISGKAGDYAGQCMVIDATAEPKF